jgi:hypothetical protein
MKKALIVLQLLLWLAATASGVSLVQMDDSTSSMVRGASRFQAQRYSAAAALACSHPCCCHCAGAGGQHRSACFLFYGAPTNGIGCRGTCQPASRRSRQEEGAAAQHQGESGGTQGRARPDIACVPERCAHAASSATAGPSEGSDGSSIHPLFAFTESTERRARRCARLRLPEATVVGLHC